MSYIFNCSYVRNLSSCEMKAWIFFRLSLLHFHSSPDLLTRILVCLMQTCALLSQRLLTYLYFLFKATTLYPSKRKVSDKEGEFYFRYVLFEWVDFQTLLCDFFVVVVVFFQINVSTGLSVNWTYHVCSCLCVSLSTRDLKVPDVAGPYCMVVQFGSGGAVTLSSKPVRAPCWSVSYNITMHSLVYNDVIILEQRF